MKKLSNAEAELKKSVAYEKKSTYTRFGSSQPLVSLKITTIAPFNKETSVIIPNKGPHLFIKYLLGLNTFGHF